MTECRVLTYNIWFDKRQQDERLDGVKSLIVQLQPTIICLQEVTNGTFPILFNYLTLLGYNCNYKRVQNFKPSNGYGVCIFSLIPIIDAEIINFKDTTMGRYFVRVLLENGICVVTTHLESLPLTAHVRKKQLQQLAKHCISPNGPSFASSKPHIITMDSNITDVGDDVFPTNIPILNKWIDLFEVAGRPQNEMYSYDATKNNNILYKYRSRLDRIFLTVGDGRYDWKILYFKLEGKTPLQNTKCPPSDHFAIFTSLVFS